MILPVITTMFLLYVIYYLIKKFIVMPGDYDRQWYDKINDL